MSDGIAAFAEQADILVALFWHRLGSPTGEAASGTIEEIEGARAKGAYVAILRCTRGMPVDADPDQIAKLGEFLADAQPNSLILEYDDEGELARHVDAILNRAVTAVSTRAEAALPAVPLGTDVWPRVERSEEVRSDGRGRVRTSTRWQLVLSNTGTEPARNVRFRLESESGVGRLPTALADERPVEVLAPGGEAGYVLILYLGVESQVRCVVTWSDSRGEHENQATLRFF